MLINGVINGVINGHSVAWMGHIVSPWDFENRIPFDPFKDSCPSALSISLFDPFERGAAPPAQNGRLTPFEPFERLGRRAAGSRRHVTARISASQLHQLLEPGGTTERE